MIEHGEPEHPVALFLFACALAGGAACFSLWLADPDGRWWLGTVAGFVAGGVACRGQRWQLDDREIRIVSPKRSATSMPLGDIQRLEVLARLKGGFDLYAVGAYGRRIELPHFAGRRGDLFRRELGSRLPQGVLAAIEDPVIQNLFAPLNYPDSRRRA